MHFTAIAKTDIGIAKDINQDSLLLKHADCSLGEVIMAVVCDGMGGLAKGEVASAAVIHEFSRWFDNELPYKLEKADMQSLGREWSNLLRDLNERILAYSRDKGINMGTTFTGILFVGGRYLIVHVGDSRAYYITSSLRQLTTDHTFVAREVRRGNMTLHQAETDKRRNMLLQCIGASESLEPEVIAGEARAGVYMLCSDGFRNKITEAEMCEALNPKRLHSKKNMNAKVKHLLEEIKARREQDNISVILIKAD